MSLCDMNTLLTAAQKGNYAVPAFNVCNLEYSKVAIETAEELNSPVIIALHPVEIEYAGLEEISVLLRVLASKVAVPVALHLDHGDSLERALLCILNGFTSVMFDGSALPYEENVRLSAEVVKIAHMAGVTVEAELGVLGGIEGTAHGAQDCLTRPDQAKEFAARTGVDALAIAIGTAHGMYRGTPHIDIQRLQSIREVVHIPLVLHGGSDTPDDKVRECISNGICKVNIATEYKLAFHSGVLQSIEQDQDAFDPRVSLRSGMRHAKELIRAKITLFGSQNRA